MGEGGGGGGNSHDMTILWNCSLDYKSKEMWRIISKKQTISQ